MHTATVKVLGLENRAVRAENSGHQGRKDVCTRINQTGLQVAGHLQVRSRNTLAVHLAT